MTQSINALSGTTRVSDWLASSRSPQILHIFERACNLVNEHRQVLSLVTPDIGKGPFNLVLENDPRLTAYIHLTSPISIDVTILQIGGVTIQTQNAELWNPRPNWETWHARQGAIFRQVKRLSNSRSGFSNLQFSKALSASLAVADLPSCVAAAKNLAGLGQGLTPSGDDYIMGALYALSILHPHAVAGRIARETARAAAALTTSLSGAWLNAAGDGEAGIAWHNFVEALLSPEEAAVDLQFSNILSIGATSGADALAGFMDTFIAYMETEKTHVFPKLFS